jgi:membrane protein
VSLVVSAAVAFLLPNTGAWWDLLNLAVSLLVFVALFALVFKFLPDVEIAWKDVWVGAALTAVLFAVGKYFIGLYLGKSSFTSSYGAAGSLVALLA